MKKSLSSILSKKLNVNEVRVKKALSEARKEMAGGEKKETMVEYVKRMKGHVVSKKHKKELMERAKESL